jgi:hypothetical protein
MKYTGYLITTQPSNSAEKMFQKLSIERVITNLSQLVAIYKKHTELTFTPEKERAWSRTHKIRQALVHVNTDIEAFDKAMNTRGNYNIIGPNTPTAIQFDGIGLGNNFTDDIKVFYGSAFVLIRRDLLRLVCRLTEHYNAHATIHKLEHGFEIGDLYELADSEPVYSPLPPLN